MAALGSGALLLFALVELISAPSLQHVLAMALVPAVLLAWLGLVRGGRYLVNGDHPAHDLVIIGKNRRTCDYLEAMERFQESSVKVVGVLDCEMRQETELHRKACDDCDALLRRHRIPVLGGHTHLRQVICENPIDEVLITLPIKSFYDEIDGCLKVCQEAGVPVSLSVDFFGLDASHAGLLSFGNGGYRINYTRSRHPRWKLAVKRTLDIAGAVIALAIFAIPMALVALAVKLTSRGPVLFVQERAGLNHKRFKLLKFRTMIKDAEQIRPELDHLNEQAGPVFKMRRDPRVTSIGRFLRKYSLDELPQLFNVLVGDMSLVGPRPPIPSEVNEYEWWQRRRLSTRPGLTCLWQVSGRNRIGFDEWMRLDLAYIDDWSLLLDIKILLQTVPTLLKGSGV